MKTITLTCHQCQCEFEKSLKEHTRRVNGGYRVFFCSRSCSGHHNVSNLPDPNGEENVERLKRNVILARTANTKFSNDELIFQNYIRKADKRKRLNTDITITYLKELWERQGGRCALSNIPIEHPRRGCSPNTKASLDRIDSSKGYIEGNVQFLSCAMNWAKNSGTDDDLRNLIALIKLHS